MSMSENAALVLPWLARGRALASVSNGDDAARWLIEKGALRAARILQKAAVPASSTADSDTGVMIGAYTSSMATASVFYKLLDGCFRKLPMFQRIGLATSSPTAGILLEGQAGPVSRIVIGNTVLRPVTVASMLVATREMLFDPGAESLFNRELKNVIGQAVDAAFLSDIARRHHRDEHPVVRYDTGGRRHRCKSGVARSGHRRRRVAAGMASGSRCSSKGKRVGRRGRRHFPRAYAVGRRHPRRLGARQRRHSGRFRGPARCVANCRRRR